MKLFQQDNYTLMIGKNRPTKMTFLTGETFFSRHDHEHNILSTTEVFRRRNVIIVMCCLPRSKNTHQEPPLFPPRRTPPPDSNTNPPDTAYLSNISLAPLRRPPPKFPDVCIHRTAPLCCPRPRRTSVSCHSPAFCPCRPGCRSSGARGASNSHWHMVRCPGIPGESFPLSTALPLFGESQRS